MARPVKYQNSYRLTSKKPFNSTEVEKILAKVMDDHFKELERFSEATVNICRNVSEDAMNLIKALNFDRYKIIVVVTVVEKFMEGICYSNKSLWDATKDSLCSYTYDHPNFFGIAVCYGIYFD